MIRLAGNHYPDIYPGHGRNTDRIHNRLVRNKIGRLNINIFSRLADHLKVNIADILPLGVRPAGDNLNRFLPLALLLIFLKIPIRYKKILLCGIIPVQNKTDMQREYRRTADL